jgi:tetratricopeptide (TPR) repeat protein
MADVTLHQYCKEAKELIKADRYDEAIAICRHLLQHFSKYIAAYRLLGEASLEKGEYVDAANLFKRVLGADLEDVIAYVGLGIVYDAQGALEEAVWQLERAFELAPGNAEIRAELQRLHAGRDETKPVRLKLTRAALGRLYLKEELYERAVGEFRAVLEEDPERADIQVALAQALWWIDQRREAASICEELLEEFPNCLKANLILGEILLSSGGEDEGRVPLRTAQAMDPENIVAQELFRDQSPLASEPVYVRRLEDKELEELVEEIGVAMPAPKVQIEPEEEAAPSLAEAELDEAMPEWLRKLREGEAQPLPEQSAAPTEAEEMPAWLRGTGEGTPEEEKEPPMVPGEEVPPVPEEVPGWLRELQGASEPPGPGEAAVPLDTEDEGAAPPEAAAEEGPAEEVAEEGAPAPAEEVPEWLRQVRTEAEEEVEPPSEFEEEIPDWLRALREEAVEPGLSEEEVAAEAGEEVPEWLGQLREGAGEEEVITPAEEEASPVEATGEEPPPQEVEPTPEVVEEGPAPEAAVEELRAVELEDLEISEEAMARLRETMPDESASIDEIMAWLDRSSAIMGEPKPIRAASGVAEGEEPPAWVRELRAESMQEEVGSVTEEVEPPVEELAASVEEEEVPAWLRELGAEAGEEEAEPSALEEVEAAGEKLEPPIEEEEVPAWLGELRAEAGEEEVEPSALEAVEAAAEELEPSVEEEELPTWLRELGAEAAEEEVEPGVLEEVEALVEEAAASAEEELPAWLQELRAEGAEEGIEPGALEGVEAVAEEAEPTLEELAAPAEEEEVPAWLQELRAEEPAEPAVVEELEAAAEEAAASVEEELPAWLQELRAEAAREEAERIRVEGAEAPLEEVAVPPEEEQVPTEVVEPEVKEAVPAPAAEEAAAELLPEAAVAEVAPTPGKAREEGVEGAWSEEEYLSRLAADPEDHEGRLGLARSYVQAGDLDQAVSHYQRFVSSGTLLTEVIDDLESVAARLPDHLPTHELLADAYMKHGRLQKALDKYRWLRVKLAG